MSSGYNKELFQYRGGSRIFQRGLTCVKGGGGKVTIHCLNNKICELGACFLYFSYVLAQKGEGD